MDVLGILLSTAIIVGAYGTEEVGIQSCSLRDQASKTISVHSLEVVILAGELAAGVRPADTTRHEIASAVRGAEPVEVAAAYTATGVLMPPNRTPLEGPDEVRSWLEGDGDRFRIARYRGRITNFEVLETRTLVRGSVEATVVGEGGPAEIFDVSINYFMVLQRMGDEWLIWKHIWNHSTPCDH